MTRLLFVIILSLGTDQVFAAGPIKTYDLLNLIAKQNTEDTLYLSPGYYKIARTDSLVSNKGYRLKGIGPTDSIIVIVEGPKGIFLNEGADWYFENILFRNSRSSAHEFLKMQFITINNSSPIFKNCIFHRIETMNRGYVIMIGGKKSAPVFDGVIIRDSFVRQGEWGPIVILDGKTTFKQCSIGFNYSPVCEGIEIQDAKIFIIKSVLTGYESHVKPKLPVIKINGYGSVEFQSSLYFPGNDAMFDQAIKLDSHSWANIESVHRIHNVFSKENEATFLARFRKEISFPLEKNRKKEQIGAVNHQISGSIGSLLLPTIFVVIVLVIGGFAFISFRNNKRDKKIEGIHELPMSVSVETVIDVSGRLTIIKNGVDLTQILTQDQYLFMEYLVRHSLIPQCPLHTNAIFMTLWPEESYRLQKNNRNVFIHRFREKLEAIQCLHIEVTAPRYLQLKADNSVKINQ